MSRPHPLMVLMKCALKLIPSTLATAALEDIEHLVHKANLHSQESVFLILQERSTHGVWEDQCAHLASDITVVVEKLSHNMAVSLITAKYQRAHREHIFNWASFTQKLRTDY
nr:MULTISPECIES: hypothetical protein [Pseudomonas]